jgi:purine-nucleoside phosphorylase
MLVADHINATGVTPIAGDADRPFVNMVDAYAPHLRLAARQAAGDERIREGIYAGVRGPQYETPAEAQALRRLGADAVGMSTVLETIAARALGLDVLGISLITNVVAPVADVSHDDVLAASRAAAQRMARVIGGVLALL